MSVLTFLIPAKLQIFSLQVSPPLDIACIDLLERLNYLFCSPIGLQRDIAALIDHRPVVHPVDLDQERLAAHLRLEEALATVLGSHRSNAQKYGPPVPISILEHVHVPRPLDLLRRAVVPQGLSAILPGPVHSTSPILCRPAAEDPLLVPGFGAALSREEVVEVPAAKDVRALGDAVRRAPDHDRRRQRSSRRQVDLRDVDAKVLLLGPWRPILEPRRRAEVDFGCGVVPEKLDNRSYFCVNGACQSLGDDLHPDQSRGCQSRSGLTMSLSPRYCPSRCRSREGICVPTVIDISALGSRVL